MKKARGDAKLKTLPAERQAAIAEHAAGHTLEETLKWLRDDGIQSSRSALSDFAHWHGLQAQLRRNESTVETLLGDMARRDPNLSARALQEMGQGFFSALAVEQQDARSWYLAQQVDLKRKELELAEAKFKRETCELFLKWVEEKQAREIAAGGGSNAEKIEKLGELMFGEGWK